MRGKDCGLVAHLLNKQHGGIDSRKKAEEERDAYYSLLLLHYPNVLVAYQRSKSCNTSILTSLDVLKCQNYMYLGSGIKCHSRSKSRNYWQHVSRTQPTPAARPNRKHLLHLCL